MQTMQDMPQNSNSSIIAKVQLYNSLSIVADNLFKEILEFNLSGVFPLQKQKTRVLDVFRELQRLSDSLKPIQAKACHLANKIYTLVGLQPQPEMLNTTHLIPGIIKNLENLKTEEDFNNQEIPTFYQHCIMAATNFSSSEKQELLCGLNAANKVGIFENYPFWCVYNSVLVFHAMKIHPLELVEQVKQEFFTNNQHVSETHKKDIENYFAALFPFKLNILLNNQSLLENVKQIHVLTMIKHKRLENEKLKNNGAPPTKKMRPLYSKVQHEQLPVLQDLNTKEEELEKLRHMLKTMQHKMENMEKENMVLKNQNNELKSPIQPENKPLKKRKFVFTMKE